MPFACRASECSIKNDALSLIGSQPVGAIGHVNKNALFHAELGGVRCWRITTVIAPGALRQAKAESSKRRVGVIISKADVRRFHGGDGLRPSLIFALLRSGVYHHHSICPIPYPERVCDRILLGRRGSVRMRHHRRPAPSTTCTVAIQNSNERRRPQPARWG